MDRIFKLHPSDCGKIMGSAKSKSIPKNSSKEFVEFITEANKLCLSEGCWTLLKQWYSGDRPEAWSKEIDKGNIVEQECIDLAARVLNLGIAKKNSVTKENDFIIGTCDVEIDEFILEIKSPYSRKTFLDNINEIDPCHEWQLRCYLYLYNKTNGILFYGLCNTPATEYTDEIVYDDLPDAYRYIAYKINRDNEYESAIINKIINCRLWLELYDDYVKSRTGKIN